MPRHPKMQPYEVRFLCRATFGPLWFNEDKKARVAWARAQVAVRAAAYAMPAAPAPPPSDAEECCICMDSRSQVTFYPCGHTCVCVGCAVQLGYERCPLCRTTIDWRERH